MYKHIQQQNKNIAKVGQAIIICLMLIVVGNNIITIGSALQFTAPTGTSGAVANGNGFFDDELTVFNSTSNRNIYTIAEPTQISIVEPLGYPLGISAIQSNLVSYVGGSNYIRYGLVASDGYLYYVDGSGIKRKNSRSNSGNTNASDIGSETTKSVLIYSSANIYSLYEFQSNIYFIESTTLKYFDLATLQTTTKYASLPVSNYASVSAVYLDGTYLNLVYADIDNVGNPNENTYLKNSTGTQYLSWQDAAFSGGTPMYASFFVTSNYFVAWGTRVATPGEFVYIKSNNSVKYNAFYISANPTTNNGINLGGYSTTALYANSASTYNVFNFIESGLGVPFNGMLGTPALSYDTAYVKSVYDEYYNNSDFTIEYRLNFSVPYTAFAFDTLLGIPIGNPYLRYQYRTDLMAVNPNTGLFSSVLSSYPISDRNGVVVCQVPGIDFLIDPNRVYNCHAAGTYQIHPSSGIWANGTYRVQLQEITISNSYLAGLSFDDFLVLNRSGTGNVIVIPPGTYPWLDGGDTWKPPNTEIGSTCTAWDDYTSILGMGINNPSRFAFATLIIVFAIAIGLFLSKGNFGVGLCLGFLPYAYFTYLSILTPCGEYMPTWVIVFIACIIAIKMRWF